MMFHEHLNKFCNVSIYVNQQFVYGIKFCPYRVSIELMCMTKCSHMSRYKNVFGLLIHIWYIRCLLNNFPIDLSLRLNVMTTGTSLASWILFLLCVHLEKHTLPMSSFSYSFIHQENFKFRTMVSCSQGVFLKSLLFIATYPGKPPCLTIYSRLIFMVRMRRCIM